MPKNKSNRQPGPPKVQSALETLDVVHPNAAAADIGSREIWISLPPNRPGETVRCFGTFTPDLESLVQWLLENRTIISEIGTDMAPSPMSNISVPG